VQEELGQAPARRSCQGSAVSSPPPPAPTRSRPRRRGRVRAAILASAPELLAEQGVGALSMRRLADRCGYTVPTLYHHFGDKLGLVEAVLDEVFGGLVEALRDLPDPPGPEPGARLRALVRCFVAFGLRVPVHYQLLMTPVADAIPMPSSVEQARALLDDALAGAAHEGWLRDVDPARAAQVIYVTTHGLVSLPSQRPDIDWADDLVEATIDGLLHGLVAPAGARA